MLLILYEKFLSKHLYYERKKKNQNSYNAELEKIETRIEFFFLVNFLNYLHNISYKPFKGDKKKLGQNIKNSMRKQHLKTFLPHSK